MSIPVICQIDYETITASTAEKDPRIKVSGTLQVVWDYKTDEPTDIAGFDLEIETEGDVIHGISGVRSPGNSVIQKALETVLNQTLLELADEHCEPEPPDDPEDSIEYQAGLDDFYPSMPRG